jgi:hypothetical protein
VKPTVHRLGTRDPAIDDTFKLLTARYRVAYEQYQGITDKNAELSLTGSRPSEEALLDEERAFDELDVARHALLDAASQAYPTVH